ncbi:MAG: ATP synthase subunit I [Cyanobacteriota bacterium]
MAIVLATPPDADAPASVEGGLVKSEAPSPSVPDASPSGTGDNGMDHYHRLRRRLLVATTVAAALAVPIVALTLGLSAAFSALLGALCGLLYLMLLSRSVTRLGVSSKSVGKVQLLVPIVLVLTATKVPQLHVLPALLGFLLYKPALLVQALLDA